MSYPPERRRPRAAADIANARPTSTNAEITIVLTGATVADSAMATDETASATITTVVTSSIRLAV
jgi:hypothetical protein